MPADEIVFVDDNPTYVKGGRKAGLRSVLLDVRDPAGAFRQAVLQLGLPWGVLP
jgi:FMN phosphatase YigB (HAD superfamily)